jgi:hypothetical protein
MSHSCSAASLAEPGRSLRVRLVRGSNILATINTGVVCSEALLFFCNQHKAQVALLVSQIIQWAGRCRGDGNIKVIVPQAHMTSRTELSGNRHVIRLPALSGHLTLSAYV